MAQRHNINGKEIAIFGGSLVGDPCKGRARACPHLSLEPALGYLGARSRAVYPGLWQLWREHLGAELSLRCLTPGLPTVGDPRRLCGSV